MNPVLQIDSVAKNYGGLRPLRIQGLAIQTGERVALVGFDQPAAEMFVNLVTGQTLPDEGRVAVFGEPTSAIADSTAWLQFVDRFGIVSERAVLLEPLTVTQNLAMPFTLSIDPLDEDVRRRAEAIAREVVLPEATWTAPVAPLDAAQKMRVRLGRALALDPAILVLDHVSAGLSHDDAASLANTIAEAAGRRSCAVVALTRDEAFARAVAGRVLRWEPASGRLAERRGWFGGRLG